MTRRLRLLPVACTALALLATSSPAKAEISGADVLTCQFNAVLAPAPAVRNLVSILNGPIPQSGAFLMTTAGVSPQSTCVEVRAHGLSSSQSVGFVNMDANGIYLSYVCGTGTLAGNLYVNAGSLSPPDNLSSAFQIAFAGGSGGMTLSGAYNSEGTGGDGVGYVNIVPDGTNAGGNCINEDVNRFKVTGAFTVAIEL